MSKKAVNLWLTEPMYMWLKAEADRRGVSMTHILKELLRSEKQKIDAERRPEQY